MAYYKLGFNPVSNEAFVITDGTFPTGALDLGIIDVPNILSRTRPSFTLFHLVRDAIYSLGEIDMEEIYINPVIGPGTPSPIDIEPLDPTDPTGPTTPPPSGFFYLLGSDNVRLTGSDDVFLYGKN